MSKICQVIGCERPLDGKEDGKCPRCGADFSTHPPVDVSDATVQAGGTPGNETPAVSSDTSGKFAISWPWAESTEISGRLFVGRVPPTSSDLAVRLEKEYGNVSRLHAEIWVDEGRILVRDFNSVNGTFINGQRLEPHREYEIKVGAQLQFATNLTVSITTEE